MKQLNRIAERDIGLFLDAIRFGLATTAMAFGRIKKTLSSIGDNPLHSPSLEDTLTLINDCWLMVDTSDRTRQIVEKFSILGNSLPERKKYLASTKEIRKLRNTYHHVEDQARRINERSSSVFGALFWVSPRNDQLMHALVVKSGAIDSSYQGLTYDRLERRFTTEIQFQAYGHEIDLFDVANANEKFAEALESLLDSRGISRPERVTSFRFSMDMNKLA